MISKIRSLVAVVCILLVFGCSSSGGGSDDQDDPENPGTPENPVNPGGEESTLVGTWESGFTKDLFADDDTTVIGEFTFSWTMTFGSDGSYTWFEGQSKVYPDDPDRNRSEYSAQKGLYTATDSFLNLNNEYEADSDDPFSDVIPWSAEYDRWGIEYAVVDGKLYIGILSRSGEGSGIEGVWTTNVSELDEDDFNADGNVDDMIDARTTYTIDANEIRHEWLYDVDGEWVVDPDESWSAEYEIVDEDSIEYIYDDGYTYRGTYLVTDDYLYLDDRMYPPLAKK